MNKSRGVTQSESIADQKATIAGRALHTAKWARIMTKWLVTHSTANGVKWQVISFNGSRGHESAGIVDMIAIRKDHKPSDANISRGDLFEIVLIQVKGGRSKLPSQADVNRLLAVQAYHRANKVILAEWKKGRVLCCYVLPDMKTAVPASAIFGKTPDTKQVGAKLASSSQPK